MMVAPSQAIVDKLPQAKSYHRDMVLLVANYKWGDCANIFCNLRNIRFYLNQYIIYLIKYILVKAYSIREICSSWVEN